MNIDATLSKKLRVAAYWPLINKVVDDLDGDKDETTRQNIKKFMLHVAWHEGTFLTQRVQQPSGPNRPGRSFLQMEPPRTCDAYDFAKQKGFVDRLVSSSGASQAQLDAARQEIEDEGLWPSGNRFEEQLRTCDLFGLYLARIALKREAATIGFSNLEHANYWADKWKVVFTPPSSKREKVKTFKSEADEVDGLLALILGTQSSEAFTIERFDGGELPEILSSVLSVLRDACGCQGAELKLFPNGVTSLELAASGGDGRSPNLRLTISGPSGSDDAMSPVSMEFFDGDTDGRSELLDSRPSFDCLNGAYSMDPHICPDITPSPNQCAVRLSRALISCNVLLDDDFMDKKCRHGFARGAQDLGKFLKKKWGVRDEGFEAPNAAPDSIKNRKAVILFANIPDFSGQGHIDLWDGSSTRSGEFWNANPIWVWFL